MLLAGCHGVRQPFQVRTTQGGCTQQRSFQSPIDPFSGPYDHNSAKSGTAISGFVHFSPRSPIWGPSRARKCPHLATIQKAITGFSGLGHMCNTQRNQT